MRVQCTRNVNNSESKVDFKNNGRFLEFLKRFLEEVNETLLIEPLLCTEKGL